MHDPHLAVLASAGTGKTHQLTSRYIELVARGVEPASILATTFTRKAAGEIRGRILRRLVEAIDDDRVLQALNGEIGLRLNRVDCEHLIVRLARQIHRLHISTIDSFFAQIMSGFALDLGIPPGSTMADEEQDVDLRSTAVATAIESSGMEREVLAGLVRMLASGQFKRSVHGAVLGAVDVAYEAFLPSRSTPRAWEVFGSGIQAPDDDEVNRLLAEARSIQVPRTQGGTPHKHFASNVGALVQNLHRRRWKELLAQGLVAKVSAGGDTFSSAVIAPDARASIERIVEAVRRAILATLYRRNTATRDFLHRFDVAYQQLKADRRVLRFDDVPRAILEACVQDRRDEMYYRLDRRIDHLLLDEFQDTSLDQFAILKPILDELLAHADGSRTVLCVGDVKQSLYSWRGAEPELLPALPRRWPQIVQKRLWKNRRSSPAILAAVNDVFEGIAGNPVVSGFAAATRFGEGYVRHEAHKADLPGEVRLTCVPDSDDDEPDSKTEAARFIARRVWDLRELAPGASIAVLTRTNAMIPRLIFELRDQGVPAIGERGNPLTDTPAAAVAISALHLADHPSDSAALFHVATSPLGVVLGVKWRPDREANRAEGRWIASRLRMKLAKDGMRAVLERWQRRLAASMDPLGYARFDQLIDEADVFDRTGDGRPESFVQLVRRKSIEPPAGIHREESEGGEASVRIMTIHAAKGLEFDAVILPELERAWSVSARSVLIDRRDENRERDALSPVAAVTTYPSEEVRSASPDLEDLYAHTLDRIVGEELSSLYVAMTRAKRYLEVIGPESERTQSRPTALRVLRSALKPDGYRTDKPWHSGVSAPRAEPRPERSVRWRVGSDVPAGRLSTMSPSSLEGEPRLDLGDVWRSVSSSAGLGAKDRGTAIHAMFEAVGWLDDATPSRADLIRAAAGAGATGALADQWVDTFSAQLRGDVERVLRRERYAGQPGGHNLEVRREWSFAVREARPNEVGHILNGTIDRLVLGLRGGTPLWAEVIDFKSDDVNGEAEVTSRVEHYRPQIEAYKRAVGAIYGLEPDRVKACLVFTGPARIVAI